MIGKLLSLLTTAKGAAAAAVVAAAAVGTGVVATNTDVQSTLGIAAPAATSAQPSPSGQPAVVAARNGSDKALRDAFQDDQQKVEKLRGTRVEGADRAKLDDLVKAADTKLRDRLTKALNDVAALTLGREGLESPRVSGGPRPSASPDVRVTFTAETRARIDAVVKSAVAEMAAIVADAEKAVAALPTARPEGQGGRPSESPGGRPGAAPAGQPSGPPAGGPGGGRPSGSPGRP